MAAVHPVCEMAIVGMLICVDEMVRGQLRIGRRRRRGHERRHRRRIKHYITRGRVLQSLPYPDEAAEEIANRMANRIENSGAFRIDDVMEI
jgi:hypothetical protein